MLSSTDVIALVSILSAVGSLIISIMTHIKTSSCYGFKMKTTEDSSRDVSTTNV